MAAISASLVKELRERTGLGMMECKKALTEADGDIERAIEDLRKNSGLKAAKKAGRIAAEGAILTQVAEDGSCAAMLAEKHAAPPFARVECCRAVETTRQRDSIQHCLRTTGRSIGGAHRDTIWTDVHRRPIPAALTQIMVGCQNRMCALLHTPFGRATIPTPPRRAAQGRAARTARYSFTP